MKNIIINIILAIFNLSSDAVLVTGRRCRKREIVICRQAIHYFINQKTKYTLGEIGIMTGGKNHATVLHSIKSIKAIKSTNYLPYSDYIKQISIIINYSYKDYINDINKLIKVEYPKIEVKNYSPFKYSNL